MESTFFPTKGEPAEMWLSRLGPGACKGVRRAGSPRGGGGVKGACEEAFLRLASEEDGSAHWARSISSSLVP